MTKKHTVLNICSSNTINIKNIIKLIKTRYNLEQKILQNSGFNKNTWF